MIFVGCYTGANPHDNSSHNLPHAAVAAGSSFAIGFINSIQCTSANTWIVYFFESYAQGNTVNQACQYACSKFSQTNNIRKLVIISSND